MGMTGIAKYMVFSQAIDMTREKDRYLRLPGRDMPRTVLMTPNRAATFIGDCSRRALNLMRTV